MRPMTLAEFENTRIHEIHRPETRESIRAALGERELMLRYLGEKRETIKKVLDMIDGNDK